MDINELVLTDEAQGIIENGTWVGDFVEAPDVEFLVCGVRSVDAQKCIDAKKVRQTALNKGKPLSNAQLKRIMQETLCEVILKDWRGLKNGGKDLPYSKELATKFILSRNGEKFAELVLQAAQKVDENAHQFAEELKKS